MADPVTNNIGSRRRSSIQSIRNAFRRSSLASVKSLVFGRRGSTISRVEPLVGSFIEQVRTVLLELINQHEKDVHPDDIKMVENDYFIRFLIMEFAPNDEHWEDDVEEKIVIKVAKEGLSALKFRKKNQVHEYRYQDFPKEFDDYNCGHVVERPYPLPFLSTLCIRRLLLPSDWKQFAIQYCLMLTHQIFDHYEQRGLIVLLDSKGMSMGQLEMMGKLVYAMIFCFPGVFREIYVVDLPFMLKAGYYMLSKAFPGKILARTQLINRATLIDKFGKENLPPYLGGKLGPHIKTIQQFFDPDDTIENISPEEFVDKHHLERSAIKLLQELTTKAQKIQ